MLQIAVCEDEQADRDNLIGILKPLLDNYIEEYRITDFTTGEELLQSNDIFHLNFMDIMMEGSVLYKNGDGKFCSDVILNR